jgi:hypothetical protein
MPDEHGEGTGLPSPQSFTNREVPSKVLMYLMIRLTLSVRLPEP